MKRQSSRPLCDPLIVYFRVLLLQFACVGFLFVPNAYGAAEGVDGWDSQVAGVYGSAGEACHAQWVWAGMSGGRSRFIGAMDGDIWWAKSCLWTQAQWLCPEETPNQPGSCGTRWPGGAFFQCLPGYTLMFPFRCVLPAGVIPERPQQCYDNGGKTNPTSQNPVVIATGAKVLGATDFASDDGRFTIKRLYRSFPVGYSLNAKYAPLGLPYGWQFNFAVELQLGAFSGSPGSPNGNITLIMPDGSGYDFTLNSSGVFLPRTQSGAVSTDYKLEFVGTLPTNLATIPTAQTEWKVTGPDDRVWTLETVAHVNAPTNFNVARPVSFADRDGYGWTFTYGTDGALSTIADTFGRTATFTWNYFYVTFLTGIAGALPYPEAIDTITFPDGTSAKYTYDPAPVTTPPSTSKIERLVGVSLRDGSLAVADSTTYHYEDPDFGFALTGITDHRNVRIATYGYDDLGRATSTKGADDQNEITITYGSSGNLVTRQVTNALGRVTEYRFEKIGASASDIRLVGVDGQETVHCPASAAIITYNGSGFIASTTDEEGRVTTYIRDSQGRPTSIVVADGTPAEQETTITWDTTFNVPLIIERPGLTTTRVYNGSGQLTSLTETDTTSHTLPYPTNGETRTWAYTYTTGGLVATVDGPLPGTGDTVSYTYDAEGYVETYTNEIGHVTTVLSVNGRGQPTSIEDASGPVTNISYDAVGRVISTVADPSGVAAETLIDYDEAGNVIKITKPDGSYLETEYDDNSRIISIANGLGDKAEYTYNDMGNVTSQEVYNGFPALYFKWEQAFDELGRVIEVIGAGPASWTYSYDKVGNLITSADPNNETVTRSYDGLDRLITFTDERLSVTSSAYGDTDAPVSTTDPRSVVTTYVRNGWGEAIQEQSNDIGATVYERNQKGDVVERTNARGVIAEFSYDDAGRETAVTYPAESVSDVTYTYDSTAGGNFGIGRLTGVTDAAGTVAYTYDILGRVTLETRVIGTQTYQVGYQWDADGKVVEVTYPSGRKIFFDRNVNGDIDVVRTQPSGGSVSSLVTSVSRTPFGPRSIVEFANDVREERSYDQDGRVVSLDVLETPSTYLIRRGFEYADKRNLTAIKDLLTSANNEDYRYTANGFLKTANGPWSGVPAGEDVYSLGSGSNRLTGVSTNGTPSRSFVSDSAGNITEDTNLTTSTTKELAYNHPGRLTSVEIASSPVGVYQYDFLSRLVSRELPASSTTLHLVHDLDGNVIAEYNSSGTVQREYVWLEDRPVAAIVAGSPPVVYSVHTDHLERPVMMTDGSAASVWQASYLPYGEVASIAGAASLDYRFPGQWFQLESSLHYNWHRHYDATTGRYVQPDPLGMPDGPSRWAYGNSSPLMNVDPEGLFQKRLDPRYGKFGPILEFGGGGGGGYGGGGGPSLGAILGGLLGLGIDARPKDPSYRPPMPPSGGSCYPDDDDDGPCEKQFQDDELQCVLLSMRGGGLHKRAGKQWYARCIVIAETRYAECKRFGSPRTPFPIWNM